jgi:glyoxylase-like metal-dependent hydrolase (beta-lactamase superfamily II)
MTGKPTGKPIIHAFFDEPTNTVSYIVADPATKEAALIDPVLDYDPGASEVDTRSVEAMLASPRTKAIASPGRSKPMPMPTTCPARPM